MTLDALPWERPEWEAETGAWTRAALAAAGIALTGTVERERVRPWSAVLRAETDRGTVYIKQAGVASRHETPLTVLLDRDFPDLVPHVLAANVERGWLILADGGVRLRDLLRAGDAPGAWSSVLPRYAAMQIALIDRVEELLALDVPDRRPEALPALYAAVLEDEDALFTGPPDGLTPETHARLWEMEPAVRAWCEVLAGCAIPPSVQHDDLHDGNVFVRDGRAVVADWGDSCLGHPFGTLPVLERSAADTMGLDRDAPEVLALREMYLAPWRALVSPERITRRCR